MGQHFLISESAVGKILLAAGSPGSILEIGPGPAVLTEPLANLAPTTAIEMDARMVRLLASEVPAVTVIQQDALKVDWKALLTEMEEPRVIVSNMPYNITGPLLGKVCGVQTLISHAVLMMQREVAERILAQPGDPARGSLSVVLQRLFEIQKVASVPPGAFMPPPKVDSTVLRLTPKAVDADETFQTFVRQGFRQPRKTLANNLGPMGKGLDFSWLAPQVRPHQLSEAEWMRLYDAFRRSRQG